MKNKLWIPALIPELAAVRFLTLSMATVFRAGEPNRYLTTAPGLNCIAIFLNLAGRKNHKRKDAQKK